MSAPPRGPLNVVLVDDDETDATSVQRAFERAGVESHVFFAGDALEGLKLLRSGSVPAKHLVLVDVNMPRMSGIEFLQALRGDPKLADTVVVVLSASRDARDVREAYRLHAAGYLLKPSSSSEFLELISALDRYWSSVEL